MFERTAWKKKSSSAKQCRLYGCCLPQLLIPAGDPVTPPRFKNTYLHDKCLAGFACSSLCEMDGFLDQS